MYNRCCRGNISLKVAMQGLHFKKYLKDCNENIDKTVLEELEMPQRKHFIGSSNARITFKEMFKRS